MSRLRYDFITGLCSVTSTTMTVSGGFPVTLNSGNDYIPVAINPAPFAASITSTTNTEIVWVTQSVSGSSSVTVQRGMEGTTALASTIWPAGTPFVHGATIQDYGIANMMANGDFPTPTASGQVLKATASGAFAPAWASPSVPATAITSGALAPGVTISGSQVFGNLSNATISGVAVYGNLSNATHSGSQIYGNLSNATISGSAVVSPVSTINISGSINATTVTGILSNATISVSGISYFDNPQTVSYTITAADANNIIRMNTASNTIVYLPAISPFIYGQQTTVIRQGAGSVTFSGSNIISTSSTINAPYLRAQYSVAAAIYLGSSGWVIAGDIL